MDKNVLLFGGTFDPVHNGHLIVARSLATTRGFDVVVLVPTANPPHKPNAFADADDRLAMLRLAIADDPLFRISEVELRRDGPSYTYDTLLALGEEYGPPARLHWMIGADMLADLHKWRRAGQLVEMVEFIVVPRRPWVDRLETIFQTLARHFPPEVVQKLRAGVVDTPLVDVSSTDIRRRVRARESITGLVPDAVAAYIEEFGLYR